MDFVAQIYGLSPQFYIDYPQSKFPEIPRKLGRPYSCLIIDYFEDIFICIPFRSHVNHKYAYHFKTSNRSKYCSSGLDYSKIVLVKETRYLDSNTQAIVDQDEYRETIMNLPRIARESLKYISTYRDDLNGIKKLHPREWHRRYGRSTLPYFNELLKNS